MAIAFSEEMLIAHIYQDTLHIICLTCCGLPLGHLFVDQRAQLTQQIGAKAGAASTDRDHQIRLVDIGPFERQRTQTPPWT